MKDEPSNSAFERVETVSTSIVRQFIEFALMNKKWWLLPIVLVLLLFGVLLALSGTAAAPFIYATF